MPFVELPSVGHPVRIYYELGGESGLPVLVLSNSLGLNLSMWDRQIAGLSARYRVLRYDGRGQGRSSVTPGPYNIAQLSRDVLGLLDKLDVERAHFCGLSMGGMIGQSLGVTAADRLGKLVLANTAPKIGAAPSWNERIQAIREQGMQPMAPAALEPWFTPAFRLREPDTAARFGKMLAAADPEGYIANCAAVRDFDGETSLGSISVPTMILAGAGDPVTPPGDSRLLADGIRGAQYLELEAAHLSNIEASDAFTAGVLDFLNA